MIEWALTRIAVHSRWRRSSRPDRTQAGIFSGMRTRGSHTSQGGLPLHPWITIGYSK